jgi:hypothetical protein
MKLGHLRSNPNRIAAYKYQNSSRALPKATDSKAASHARTGGLAFPHTMRALGRTQSGVVEPECKLNAPIRPTNLTPARSRPGMDRGLQATTLSGRGDDFPANHCNGQFRADGK